VRLMVIGIAIYVACLPIIMFTSFTVDAVPKWAGRAAIVPLAIVVFFVGRWIWRSAKARGPVAEPPAASA
jgi:hypothetical protein